MHTHLAGRIAATLVLGIALGACGDRSSDDDAGDGSGDQREAQRAYEAELEGLSGVDDARVEREAFDTDYWGEEIVVDMVPTATADDVAAVLDSLTDRGRGGSPQEALVTLGAGDTDTAPDWYDADAPPFVVPADTARANADQAELLVATAAALPDAAVLVTSSEWSVFADAEGADPRQAFDAIVDGLRADASLADRGGLSITVNPNFPEGERTLQYTGDLSEESLERWHDVASVMDDEVVRYVSLYGSSDISLGVAVPDDVRPPDLTTEAYGDVLWPVIRHEIDILATLDEPAGLDVTNYYKLEADYHLEDRFIELTLGRQAHRDRKGRTWNAEAWAYLNR